MAVDDAIRKILEQSKARTAPSTSYSPLRATEVSEYEKNFRDYLAKQQNARENAVKRGIGSWIPEVPGMIADLAVDLPYNIAQRAAGRRGDSIKPLGFGEDVRRGVSQALGMAPASLGETEMSMPPDETNEAVTTALQIANPLAWMAASDPINLAKGVAKGAPKIARSLTDELFAPRVGASGQQGAIKPKGGNWLPEGTKAIEGLKPHRYAADDRKMYEAELADLMEQEARTPGRHAARIPLVQGSIAETDRNIASNNWIDKQLTSYVKNEMATPEDPIRALADAWPVQREAQIAQKAEKIKRLEDKLQSAEPRLVPYIQRDIDAVRDEIDAINSYNPLHFDAPQVEASDALDMKRQEFADGNNEKWGYGTSRLAQNWEDAADAIINKVPAERYQKQQLNRFDMTNEPGWEFINKVSPDTPLYGINNPSSVFGNSIDSLGFPHLIDELRNATNPASGLPRELLIKPESLSRLSVPQAVERVAKINEWRAEQISKARLENMLKADVHKEYPEKGMRWVQLNKKGQFAEESDAMGHSVRGYEPTEGGGSSGYGLGGWDAIQSGRAKVYSLRDAKGEPHATIEVNTVGDHKYAGEKNNEIIRLAEERGIQKYYAPGNEALWAEAEKNLAERGITAPQNITQIKGKSNRSPNEESLPFVQDFIRSGNWSDVGDLSNTGLYKTHGSTGLSRDISPEMSGNARQLAYGRASAAGEIQPYMTKAEIEAVMKKHAPEDIWSRPGQPMTEADITGPFEPEGMKRGGPVNQDAMQMAVWNKPVRKAGGSVVTQAEIDAATPPYRMPVPKRRGSIDLSGAKAAGTMLSGMAASIPAGYAGLLELARTRDPKMAADASEAMQERYMSIPEDQRTIEKVEGLAKYLEPLSVPAQYIGEKALELTGSPLAATAVEMGLDPLNYLPAIGKAPAAARAVGRAASKIASAELTGRSGLSGQRGAITYHGTPHRFPPTAKNPLGEFDPMKIGTGEGAQAYGVGAGYLAEAKDVGKRYQPRDMANEEGLLKLYSAAEKRGDYSAMEVLENAMLHKTPNELRVIHGDAGEKVIKQIEKIPRTVGSLYTVDLPDEQIAKMLDWDKPLSQQPHINTDNVLDAWNKTYKQLKKIEFGSPEWDSPTRRQLETRLHILDKGTEGTGKDYYEALKALEGFQKGASENLMQAGIPGIRYLDGGSRAGGEGTSNFVVFDPAHMNIVGREKKGGPVSQDAMQMAVWDKSAKKARGGIMGAAELAANVVRKVGAKKAEELAAIEKEVPFVGVTKKPKIKQTVTEPERIAFPGIYQRPDVIAAEAASRVAPEDQALKRLFGVTREDLYEMNKGRKGNLPGTLPGQAAKPTGSAAASKVMNKRNVQRILDVNAEAEKYPELVQGMDPWYVMDPLYQRMVELVGPEQAKIDFRKMNTLMGMASPGSEVLTEIPRGTAAYYLDKQGRFQDFIEHAGKPAYARGDVPEDIMNVPGHMYHKTAQANPMQKYLESGEMDMKSPKVPMYIEASQVPEIGFQTATPVGDAHWSRAVGLADTRGARTIKGKEVVPGASVSNPEMSQLAPWWREKIASELGIESVPAQARTWGAFSGQTGVTTPIGAPKLELIAKKIMETAQRLGVSPETARDMVIMGEAYAGKKKGGRVSKKAAGGLTSDDLVLEERKL